MMIQIPVGKIIFVMVILFATLTATFFLVRRWRVKKKKKQLQKLKEEFKEKTNLGLEETSEKDERILDKVVAEIESADQEETNTIEISLEEGYELELETPDVILLRTPRGNLHKSFRNLRIEKIKQSNGEARITLYSE